MQVTVAPVPAPSRPRGLPDLAGRLSPAGTACFAGVECSLFGSSLLRTTVIVFIFLFIAASFTAATLSFFFGGNAALWQGAVLSVPTLFAAGIFSNFRRQHVLLRVVGKITSVVMGFLNFAFLAALVCWPTLWAAKAAGLTSDRTAIASVLLAIAGVVATYGVVNAARLRVTRYSVRLENLPRFWQGRDIAVVSDLHVGAIRGRHFISTIVDRLNLIQPLAVFIPGDMFDGARVDIARTVEPWRKLRAPAGTYFVTGNHDEFVDRAPYIAALRNVGMRVLQNEKIVVDGLQIVGIHDSEAHRPTLFRTLLQRAQIDQSQPSILLTHRPAHLDIAAEAGVSLQLSGHTHAGQFPLWTLLVRKIYGRFAYGLNQFESLQVVTSSGAGIGVPPLRVGTHSEIVVLRLELATAGRQAIPPSASVTAADTGS